MVASNILAKTEITKKENFTDELKLIINSQELRNWINKEAFN